MSEAPGNDHAADQRRRPRRSRRRPRSAFRVLLHQSPHRRRHGLGLSIARSLLSASHGVVQLVESEVGAAFEVVLPRAN
ncbi:hypothetical protein ACRAWD_02690 [Caulobacter segnis]